MNNEPEKLDPEAVEAALKTAEAEKYRAEAIHFRRSWIASVAGIVGSLTGVAGIALAVLQFIVSEAKNERSEQKLAVANLKMEKAELQTKLAERYKSDYERDMAQIEKERADAVKLADSAQAQLAEIEAAKERTQQEFDRLQTETEKLTAKADRLQDFLDSNPEALATIGQTPGGEEFVKGAKDLVSATREVEQQVEQTREQVDRKGTRIYIHCANDLQAAKARRLADEMKAAGWGVQYVRSVAGKGYIPDATEVRYFRDPDELPLAREVLRFLQENEFVETPELSYVPGYESENRPKHIEIWMHQKALEDHEAPSIHEHEWRAALESINAPSSGVRTESVNKLAYQFTIRPVKEALLESLEGDIDGLDDQYIINAVVILARHPGESWDADHRARAEALLDDLDGDEISDGRKWALGELRKRIE